MLLRSDDVVNRATTVAVPTTVGGGQVIMVHGDHLFIPAAVAEVFVMVVVIEVVSDRCGASVGGPPPSYGQQ